jgi:uncharacterized 2Fe-2S/4Fe-4S cluster protein (DUF4445 family)
MKVGVWVLPAGKDLKLKTGVNLRESLIEAGIALDSPCGGQGTCLKCKVQISGVSRKLTGLEREKLSAEEIQDGWRLACHTTIEEDGEVRLPELAVSRAKAGLGLLGEEIRLLANVQRRHFELARPTLEDQKADWDRLAKQFDDSGKTPVKAELALLQDLSERLRKDDFKGEAVLVGNEVVDIDPPGSTEDILGVALDIGTTTLAVGLVDLETGKMIALDAELNPQIAFGADVISRILYMQRDGEKREQLQKELVRGLNQLLLRVCRHAGKERERIFEIAVAGNTTMLHSFLGLETMYLARAPYVGGLNRAFRVPASEPGVQIHPRGQIYLLPAIASFVGADTSAVILASRLYESEKPRLAIDIGTNGEVMLGTKDGVLTASTAAGPAFEGGKIKHGMRAVRGAIGSFQATPTLEYTVVGGGTPRGICGSGLIDMVAELYRAGVINRKGRMLMPAEMETPVAPELAERVRERGHEREFIIYSDKEREVTLTQQDVRELQLAKGALRVGIELLMKEANVKAEDIEELLLAGVFGNYINRERAVTLGLVPPFPLEKIHFIGNGAMDGALRALINRKERRRVEEVAAEVHHIELSGRPDFESSFIHCLELGD